MSALDDIRNALASSEIGSELTVAATLTTIREGAYNAAEPSAGPAKTTTPHACRAISSKFGGRFRAPAEVRENDFLATILLTSLADSSVRPQAGDTLSIPPPGKTVAITARITRVREIDPAGATATVDCKGP